MYSTCIFCHIHLGTNEAIEPFPVGRRLAFDATKGRLWVVCRACERWNLTPLDERWEAVEFCERLYRAARKRVSTEHIGLARLNEGLDLIAIGEPTRNEFAAWRYGDQFGRRLKRRLLPAGLGAVAVTAAAVGGATAGIGIGVLTAAYACYALPFVWGGDPDAIVAYLPRRELRPRAIRRSDLRRVRLVPVSNQTLGWKLLLETEDHFVPSETWTGENAVRVAALLLPHINRFGGSQARVREAVALLEESRHPNHYIRTLAHKPEMLVRMPAPGRLAFEMALHEQRERRAMEGELAALERAWREAEEIAAISDSLLVPTPVQTMFERMRKLRRGRSDDVHRH